jgi:hypothetical protein
VQTTKLQIFWPAKKCPKMSKFLPPVKNSLPKLIPLLLGWPDWANFRLLGWLFTLCSLGKITKVAHIFGLLNLQLQRQRCSRL